MRNDERKGGGVSAGWIVTFVISVMGSLTTGFFFGFLYFESTQENSTSLKWARIQQLEDERYAEEVASTPKHGERIVIDGHDAGFMPLDPDEIEEPVKLSISTPLVRDANQQELGFFKSLMIREASEYKNKLSKGTEVSASIRYLSPIDGPIQNVATYIVITDYKILQPNGLTYHIPRFSILIGHSGQLDDSDIALTRVLDEYATEHSNYLRMH